VQRAVTTAAWAWLGAWAGRPLGLLGGPLAEVTVPAGGFIGGIVGGIAGSFGGSWLAEDAAKEVVTPKK
jgi:uncharacterized membrane protein YeaQ/YmgE (transglycosylase-associated protein family)